ncbi:WD40-repeat-containing domain protein [Pseudomassariella vexata]|uniref:WD40-repeat-containing domain protein n=1 Tax=Pseudomassariella vexata TaxID=1141098 RepID=A0A1Y2EJZ0_9PEZI|nr:WD40-repeat-containing domain protein [Pseudomassariella vexata]ORY71859.1 WD40-repeat-containing domain protein [Pseudomassariella vexata]
MAGKTVTMADPISSSPPRRDSSRIHSSPPRRANAKERRNPSITPRKFRRFFTPRPRVPSHHASGHISPAREALRELAAPRINRSSYQTPAPSSPLKAPMRDEYYQDEGHDAYNTRAKRRRLEHTPELSPIRPRYLEPSLISAESPGRTNPALLSPIGSMRSCQESMDTDDSEYDESNMGDHRPTSRLAPLTSRGLTGHLLQRQLGGIPRAGRSYMACPVSDWRTETADFYTRPDDAYHCTSYDGSGRCIPFCTATCHTNSLVAVGDEEGRVRLLESSGDDSQSFSKTHLSFQAHSNAIIDLAFSSDDYLLATASGDQTGRVIDMMTQTPIAFLHHHTASLKQVRFQPGKANGSVLATSSRDGSVQIWDLRCKGPVQDIPPLPDREAGIGFRLPSPKAGCVVNSLKNAHAIISGQPRQATAGGPGDTPSRGEIPGRIGDVSVTALHFLPEGQEHLLLTACEADASIKLWDIRTTSRGKNTPVSITAPPTSHSHWRPFGISSLALSSDKSRLYALCKDNTVYAYSTPHLILGQAPDLALREPARRRYGNTTYQGLGPMYGFRHPSFHATSFYVKCAVRPARDGRSELLAVGSSDGCAVVFPTAERYFRDDLSGAIGSGVRRPLFQLQRTNTASYMNKDDIPIVRTGTPLVRGHDREVGALAWTDRGKLVTVGDDYLVRCWSEGRDQARDLRIGGETGGRRWGCGWANVGEAWDGDFEDD